uniref:Capsid protein n=1 Tax=Kellev virus TaxID=2800921 RepID=A0A894KPL8_9VIRU|nr:MAG: capsid protein [Kellev virus]QRW41862.1 MAG: capsid protein [Kellev virus]
MSKQLKKQLASLTAQVAAMKVAAKPQPKAPAKKKRNKRKRGNAGPSNSISSDGRIVVQRSELLFEIEAKAGSSNSAYYETLIPSTTKLAWLNKLSKNFSQIIWQSARLEYRPAVGAMKDGSLVLGIDWNPIATVPSKSTVQSCTPNFQVPVWQRKELTLPPGRLQSRKFYSITDSGDVPNIDKTPCEVLLYLTCSASEKTKQYFGDIWLHYRVVLQGPT